MTKEHIKEQNVPCPKANFSAIYAIYMDTIPLLSNANGEDTEPLTDSDDDDYSKTSEPLCQYIPNFLLPGHLRNATCNVPQAKTADHARVRFWSVPKIREGRFDVDRRQTEMESDCQCMDSSLMFDLSKRSCHTQVSVPLADGTEEGYLTSFRECDCHAPRTCPKGIHTVAAIALSAWKEFGCGDEMGVGRDEILQQYRVVSRMTEDLEQSLFNIRLNVMRGRIKEYAGLGKMDDYSRTIEKDHQLVLSAFTKWREELKKMVIKVSL